MIIRLVKRVWVLTILVCLLVGLAFLLVPWQIWLADKAKEWLLAQGIAQPELSIGAITTYQAHVSEISAGNDQALKVQDVVVRYTPERLLDKRIKSIEINALELNGNWTESGLQIEGIEFPESESSEASEPLPIPTTSKELQSIPLETFSISDSVVHIKADGWGVSLPFSLSFEKNMVDVISKNAHITYGKQKIAISEIRNTASLDTSMSEWQGIGYINDITTESAPSAHMAWDMRLSKELFEAPISIHLEGEYAVQAELKVNVPLKNPEKTQLKLNAASAKWGGGVVSVAPVLVKMDEKTPIRLPVKIKDISVDALMQLMSGQQVTATGTVSGNVPVIISRKGDVALGNGVIKSDSNGTLSMPRTMIPGSGTQIELTRNILENFQYQELKIQIEAQDNGGIAVLLSVKGSNPDVLNGRAANLNVRLGGDILDLVKSNVMLLTQPETLLEQPSE